MASRNLRGARFLLTGASSGIGRALAVELAQQGAELLLVARREERLRQLCAELVEVGGQATYVAGDVTEPATREKIVGSVLDGWGRLDGLINNAGVGAIGPFTSADPHRLRQVMEVNFFAPIELLRLALPSLRRGRDPIVVNIGSVLGHVAVPLKSEYCASKFALRGMSRSLRAELATERIDVLLVSPSTTATEFFEQVLDGKSPPGRRRGMRPDKVARQIVRATRGGRHELIVSQGGKWLVWLDRLFPTCIDWVLARSVR